MRTTHRSILAVLALAFLTGSTFVGQAEDYTYTTNNGTITITGYTGPGGAVTIPSEINGLPVTRIGDSTFQRCTSLTSVTIPDTVTIIGEWAFGSCTGLTNVMIANSVTSIGECAFWSCTNLTCVTIPDSVTSIRDWAFPYCAGLTAVTIGNGVTTIGEGAFVACVSLTAIAVDPKSPAYSSVDGVLFNKNRNTLMQYPCGKAGSYTIPNSVTSITDLAFHSCANLTSVTIPNNVSSIGSTHYDDWAYEMGTFNGCTRLTNVTLGNGITRIGYLAFAGCTNLTSVEIPNSVANIASWAFGWCSNLTNLTIGTGVTGIEPHAFANCINLTGVHFRGNAPRNLDSFQGADNVTVYYMPGTTGWVTTFGGRPTAPWVRPNPVILTTAPNFGVQTNAFGFMISWATSASVVVEASATLDTPVWSPVSTNTLTEGWSYFSDTEWRSYPARFYRIRSQ